MKPVYLDHNATTRPAPEVVTEMVDALERAWANPSSAHQPGLAARRLLADARARIAAFLGCMGSELVFTSGATEANHAAALGALAAARGTARRRLVLSSVEHPGLLSLAARLESQGVPVDRIPVDAQGRLDMAAARALIREDVALVSVMGANNETGVLMPVRQIAHLAHRAGCLMHVDATQLVGKAPFRFGDSGVDMASVSAHKLHGPKGVGALLVRRGVELPPLLGGRQERGRRGGTENLPGIAGFAVACDLLADTLHEDVSRMATLRQRLEQGLQQALPMLRIYGAEAPRLSNTSYLRFGGLQSDAVLGRLERAGIIVSSGAACTAEGTQPSHVLLAMGETPEHAKSGVRFSLGRETTPRDIERCIASVARALHPLLCAADDVALDVPPGRSNEDAAIATS
jgi:cysteine desulfurase